MKRSPSDETEYSPVNKKLRTELPTSATDNEEEGTSARSTGGLSSDVYAQHVGELLAYYESSALKRGLLGVIFQKTNVREDVFSNTKRTNSIIKLITCTIN